MNNDQGAVINDGKLNMVKRCEFRENYAGLIIRGEKGKRGINKGEEGKNNEFCRINPIATQWHDSGAGRSQLALVFDNIFSDNDTGIIFADSALGMVRKNEIINNLIGVYITDNALPILGIRMSGENIFQIPKSPKWLNYLNEEQENCSSVIRDFTSGQVYCTNEIASGPDKVVARNGGSKSVSYAVYNNTPNYILAEGNWWGTNDEDSIALIIWDFYDDNNLGIVDYKPFRQYELAGEKIEGGVQVNLENGIREYNLHVPTIVAGNDIYVSYTIPDDNTINRTETKVHIEIYDITGRLFKQLKFIESCGTRKYHLNCDNLTAGVYFIYFRANDYCIIRKVILVK